jgi:glyoxylase-like metal-dependent hydrolase (beta-lactamase superfamily II)
MWTIVALAVIVILIAAVVVVALPFLTWQGLPEGAKINGTNLVKDGFGSACLVPLGDHEVALVDAGNDVQGKALLAALSRNGLGPDDVKVILLTHGHPDHMAGIAKFQKAQVMALAAEVDVVEGRSSGGGPILRFRSPRPTGIRLSRTLQDGEVMPLGSYLVRVFATRREALPTPSERTCSWATAPTKARTAASRRHPGSSARVRRRTGNHWWNSRAAWPATAVSRRSFSHTPHP